jgi:predicted nucleic acid-binding protein
LSGAGVSRDEANATADQVFERVAAGRAHAPVLWWFEVRNVLVVNERRGRNDPPSSAAFLADLARLRIGLDRDADSEMVLGLARTHRLTVYDAAYLELAVRIGAPLATLDRKLAAALAPRGCPWSSAEASRPTHGRHFPCAGVRSGF